MAHELDAALAVADFTKAARIVLREVFAQIFGLSGFAGRKSATLNPSDLADRYGQKRPNISRAIKELVESGALEPLPDGTYRFIKDYEKWVAWDRVTGGKPGVQRISEKEVVACKHAPLVARAYANGCQQSERIPMDNSSEDSSGSSYPDGYANRIPMDNSPYPDGYALEPPPDPPIRQKTLETRDSQSARAADELVSDSNGIVPDTGVDPDVARMLAWADSLGYASDGIGWREWASAQAKYHTPLSWVWTLLYRRVVGAPRMPKAALLTRVISDWRMTGLPEMPPVPEPWALPAPGGPAPSVPVTSEPRRDVLPIHRATPTASPELESARAACRECDECSGTGIRMVEGPRGRGSDFCGCELGRVMKSMQRQPRRTR